MSILKYVEMKTTDPKYDHKIGYIPFAYHLVPPNGLAKIAAVMRCGERAGRQDGDWADVPVVEHLNHAMAHIQAFLSGMDGDHHLANAGCRLIMALDLDKSESFPEPKDMPDDRAKHSDTQYGSGPNSLNKTIILDEGKEYP